MQIETMMIYVVLFGDMHPLCLSLFVLLHSNFLFWFIHRIGFILVIELLKGEGRKAQDLSSKTVGRTFA